MTSIAAEWFKDHPTCKELNGVLGDRWAICRDTPRNRERYGYCITRKHYLRACAEALELRKYPNTTWSERAVWGPVWDKQQAERAQ